MNGALIFSFFTLTHAAIAVGALFYLDALPGAALCLFIVEAITAFDNGVTVLGNRLGIDQRTERLNRLRFFLHACCIGLLVPVYAGIGNALAFSDEWGVIAVTLAWVLAAGIGFYGYTKQYRGTGSIMPVNYYGCLRYAQSVSDATRHPDYEYSDEQLAARAKMPFASIATTLAGLVLSVFIGWLGDFWVPFVVTGLMLLAGAFPLRSWGPFATSCLEVVFSSGLLYSLAVAASRVS